MVLCQHKSAKGFLFRLDKMLGWHARIPFLLLYPQSNHISVSIHLFYIRPIQIKWQYQCCIYSKIQQNISAAVVLKRGLVQMSDNKPIKIEYSQFTSRDYDLQLLQYLFPYTNTLPICRRLLGTLLQYKRAFFSLLYYTIASFVIFELDQQATIMQHEGAILIY